LRIETERLILRRWRDEDLEPFAALNADPQVMRYFASTRTHQQTEAAVADMQRRLETRGFAWCAAERKEDGAFIGLIGIQEVLDPDFPFAPSVEVAWRLASRYWHQGYATEGARAALDVGFSQFRLPEIVAFTARINLPSQAVMVRLGMASDPADDFDHPAVPVGHPLVRHVLYRLKRPAE
jgi:RimJ/RimL family protein N-acetyltransferase